MARLMKRQSKRCFQQLPLMMNIEKTFPMRYVFVRRYIRKLLSITVPENLTNSVFSSLGYDIIESTAVSIGITWWKSTLNGLKNSLPYILSSAGGAIVMWYLLSGTQSNLSDVNTLQSVSEKSTSNNVSQQFSPQNAGDDTYQSPNTKKYEKSHVIIKHHYIYENKKNTNESRTETSVIENNNDLSLENLPSERSNIEITSTSLYKNEPYSLTLTQSTFNNHSLPQLQLSDSESELSNSSKEFLPLEFSIRSLQLRPQERVNVAGNDGIGINNMAIALYYRLNTDWSVGIEGGREPFSQTYSIENDIAIENIRQLPTLWWGGLTGRYEGRTLLGKDIPFPNITGAFGAAETGAYFRSSVGIGWDIVPSVTMSIGAEWAQLFYSVHQKPYKSTNFGWMYGFTIRL